ncbi:MAG: trehalose-phosphatase [Acidimicrobiia bacterium]
MAIEAALDRLSRTGRLLVGLDFDGVLAEIVARPQDAAPVPGVISVLTRLVDLDGVRVAAVSGRMRDDLAERLAPPAGVLLIGEHGADAGDAELPSPAGYEVVRAALEDVAARYDGAWVEPKRTGLTIHGRVLEADVALRMAEDAERALEPLVPGRFERGNRIVDVRLTGSTKGAAVLALREPEEVVVFVGDDTTDETVFAVLGTHDVGIKVGPGETAASCRLADPRAVVTFLEDLVAARSR